jgi:hypothetical protein
MTVVVEGHREVSTPPSANGPDFRLLTLVRGDYRDRLRVRKIDEDLTGAAADLEAFSHPATRFCRRRRNASLRF